MSTPFEKSPKRVYDIVVFGATGCMGKLVAEYLAALPVQFQIMWTIAGRNLTKLQQLSQQLQKRNLPWPDLFKIIEADIRSEESLKQMCLQTSCIINCVGPYHNHGESLVKICIETRTNYIDFCEEIPFIGDIATKYHSEAESKGVYLLPSCGVTSILPDMAVHHGKEHFTTGHCLSARGYIYATPIRRSQASLDSIMSEASTSSSQQRNETVQSGSSRKFMFDEDIKKWVKRNFGVHDLVVTRTNELQNIDPSFVYESYQEYESLAKLMISYLMSGFYYFSYHYSPFRNSDSEAGPTSVERGVGFVRCTVVMSGRVQEQTLLQAEDTNPNPTPTSSFRDSTISITAYSPNLYDGSVIIAVETALLLHKHKHQVRPRGGVLSPVVLFGNQMIRSLREGKGFKFEVAAAPESDQSS